MNENWGGGTRRTPARSRILKTDHFQAQVKKEAGANSGDTSHGVETRENGDWDGIQTRNPFRRGGRNTSGAADVAKQKRTRRTMGGHCPIAENAKKKKSAEEERCAASENVSRRPLLEKKGKGRERTAAISHPRK